MKNKPHTVTELIAILQTFPQELPILVSGYESGYENFYPPKIEKVIQHPENANYEGEYQSTRGSESNAIDVIILERVVRDD